MEALTLYRQHGEEVAARDAEETAAEAARAARREARATEE